MSIEYAVWSDPDTPVKTLSISGERRSSQHFSELASALQIWLSPAITLSLPKYWELKMLTKVIFCGQY